MPFSPNGQAANLVFLLEIEVCRRIDTATWTAAAPNCWWTPCPEGHPSRVEINGASSLSDEGDIAGCQGEEGSWAFDVTQDPAGRLYVHLDAGAEPVDASPYLGAFHWQRFNTQDGELYGGLPYRPVLDDSAIPDIAADIGGYHEGGTQFSSGAVKLLNGDGYFDALLDLYIWEAKRVIIRVGEKGKGDANYTVILDGRTGSVEWGDESVTINTEDARAAVV
jgi:hypothetical protein